MLNLSKEEIRNDEIKINDGRSAIRGAEWYKAALKAMFLPFLAGRLFETKADQVKFGVSGGVYWAIIIYGYGELIYNPSGVLSFWQGFLIVWIIAIAIRIPWRIWRYKALDQKQKAIFDEINPKYLKIKDDFVNGLFLKDGYKIAEDSPDPAMRRYERKTDDAAITFFSIGDLYGIGEVSVSAKTYRDFGKISIKRFLGDKWSLSDKRFLTGINLFDRDYEVMSEDDIKTKSFLSTTMINHFVEKSKDIKEWDEKGLTITVDGFKVTTQLHFDPLFQGPRFDSFWADSEGEYKYEMYDVKEFVKKLNEFEENYNKYNLAATELTKMIRSENA